MLWCFLRSTDSGVEEFLYTTLFSQNMSVGPSIGTPNIWMSHASISNSFNAAIASEILTESLHTTNEYVIKAGVAVLCPPPTSLDSMRKFSPILMSNIIQHLIYWYLIGRSSLRFSQTLNSGRTFFISFIIASHHSVSPFYLSIPISFFTVFGTLISYLFVLTQNLCVLEMIWSYFLSAYFTHHAKSGSSDMRFSTANPAIWTG